MLGMMQAGGSFDVTAFVQSTWTNNYYARSITFDFWTGAVAGSAFMIFEGIRLKMKFWWVCLVLVFGIGFAFGFLLFLFLRERLLLRQLTPASTAVH
jgi:hypothetical protein